MDDLIAAIQSTPYLAQITIHGWWRVHPSRYAGDAFKPSPDSNARFSPLKRTDGTVLPVMYAADMVEGALMETVFHEVPCPSAGAHLQRADIEAKSLVLSQLNCSAPVLLIDFSSTGLRWVGLAKSQVLTPMPCTTRLRVRWLSTCTSTCRRRRDCCGCPDSSTRAGP